MDGEQAGIKKVVEWIIAHKRGYYAKPDGTLVSIISAEWTGEEWQAKLKEWGIE